MVLACLAVAVLLRPAFAGTWVVDDATANRVPMASGFTIRFGADGSANLSGFGLRGTGTYRLLDGKIDIRLTKTDDGREHSALGTMAEHGRALLFDTGPVRGPKRVTVRLVRAD